MIELLNKEFVDGNTLSALELNDIVGKINEVVSNVASDLDVDYLFVPEDIGIQINGTDEGETTIYTEVELLNLINYGNISGAITEDINN